jgi:signal transduction histidine kinase
LHPNHFVAPLEIAGRNEITVADNGVGIQEEIQDQIFIPFFTTKQEDNWIGLSLCKQIVFLRLGQIQCIIT